jgi:hypothetical protein
MHQLRNNEKPPVQKPALKPEDEEDVYAIKENIASLEQNHQNSLQKKQRSNS